MQTTASWRYHNNEGITLEGISKYDLMDEHGGDAY